mmetsp:Transcript_15950/g.29207  ORF Transcript_15950/g.29207 Transcript_15950/m.29207 type:complete len:274 (-) Transcript_15950:21-842(-)
MNESSETSRTLKGPLGNFLTNIMEKPQTEKLVRRSTSHTHLKEPSSSKRMMTILTNISKLSTAKKQSQRLHSPLAPLSPQTQLENVFTRTKKRAKLKRLISELYFKKVRDKIQCPLPIGLPDCQTRAIRPIRDLTSKLHRMHKVSSFPQPKAKTPSKVGFGYVIGQRKDILGKSSGAKCRVIKIRLPPKPCLDVGVCTEPCKTMSPFPLDTIKLTSFDSPSRMSSESQDRTKVHDLLEYGYTSVKKAPKRKVIYQNSFIKGWDDDLSINYSFC